MQDLSALTKEELKRIRREEHERKMQEAAQRREAKKEKTRLQQTEARRALSEKDSRQISVKINIDEWKKSIQDEYASRYGEVEKCTFNPMTHSFDIVFAKEQSAHAAIKAPGPRLPNMPPHHVERKMNRGRCIYFGQPKSLDESVKNMGEVEYNTFANNIRETMERFGKVSKYEVVRAAQVVEFEQFENAQQVMEIARKAPEELQVDGVSLMPVFPGLPKRNFDVTKRKLQAAEKNQEEEKSKRQRLEAEQAAGKAAAAAASGGLLPDQAAQHYIAGPQWGPPPPGHWGPPPHGYYGAPPAVMHPAGVAVPPPQQGGGKKKKKGGQQAYGPPVHAYYMGYE